MTDYPLPKFHFQAEWGGVRIGFTEISGLDVETEVIEFRDGASKEYSKRKMPGLQKYPNVTMKRGVFASDNEYYKWWNTVALNTIERRDVTVSLLNEKHEPVMVWKIKNACRNRILHPAGQGLLERRLQLRQAAFAAITLSREPFPQTAG